MDTAGRDRAIAYAQTRILLAQEHCDQVGEKEWKEALREFLIASPDSAETEPSDD